MTPKLRRSVLVFVLLALILAIAGVGQGAPPPDRFAKAIAAQERNTARLLERSDVIGTAVGLAADGEPAVVVLATSRGAGLPVQLDGVPVVVRVTGALSALHHRPGHGNGGGGEPPPPEPDPPSEGDPVPIGTSTGNANECSSGTIGARLKVGNSVFALSNNHVYARENEASKGEQIVSPGLYDTGCTFSAGNVIGTLHAYETIRFEGQSNTVDAAIAATSTAEVGNSTPSDGYGTPTSSTATAAPGTLAQKYGRTTGLTKGEITMVNASVEVGYSSGVALFEGQIIFEGRKPVIKAGDSGSLLVTDPGNRPVGLLFAGTGNGKLAVANRIGDVLSAFGASIDGS